MKTILLICSFFLTEISCFSQAESFRIIYIDNCKPTREDALNEMMYDKISKTFDDITAADQKFIVFISNGGNYTLTYNAGSLDKITEKLFSTNSAAPDQFFDVEKMRDMV